jgi:ATP-binding cassette subfamily C protein LapB
MLSTSVVNVAIFFQQLVTVGVIAYGVYLIADQSLSLGGLIASVILAGRIMAPMGQVANLATHYHQTRNALQLLDRIMALPGERDPQRHYIHMPEFRGTIEFDNVSYRYPQQRNRALVDINLHINRGEHVGIIGRTGSGKSTLEKLMMGLYQPEQGYVRADGLDLRQLDPADLRSHIGYVPQDIMLFYGTIRENLLFGNPAIGDEALLKAADLASITELIQQHPMGFDMPIGEQGSGLSGGQRQSVAIARALMNEPAVVIMDEPSNAMDNATEATLRHKLKAFLENRTFVLITHKSSMLDLVDRLIVIDKGKIIADGKKDDVLAALKAGKLSA